MTDADGRLIPLVEDDQGEGIKDFIEDEQWQLDIGQHDNGKSEVEKEMLEIILDKIEKLNHRLEYIFGTHVLINGRWKLM